MQSNHRTCLSNKVIRVNNCSFCVESTGLLSPSDPQNDWWADKVAKEDGATKRVQWFNQKSAVVDYSSCRWRLRSYVFWVLLTEGKLERKSWWNPSFYPWLQVLEAGILDPYFPRNFERRPEAARNGIVLRILKLIVVGGNAKEIISIYLPQVD
jgi:hypothetical protein